MKSTIWVISNGSPVMLVDPSQKSIDGKDILRIDISKRMAKEQIPVELPDCSFVKSAINQGILIPVEGLNSRSKANKYSELRRKEIETIQAEQKAAQVLKAEVAIDVIKSLLKEK